MSDIDVNQLLTQMRAMASQAQAPNKVEAVAPGVEESQRPDFSAVLKQSVEQVSATQKAAGKAAEAFAAQDPNTDLTDVMVALQKASVSFQAMTQVRNRLVQAYQEVMSMQV